MNPLITLKAYQEQWLDEILEDGPSRLEIRQRFARKVLTQWFDLSESQETWTQSDALSDLGIDIVYLAKDEKEDDGEIGDTYYLIRSLYEGALYPYKNSVLDDGKKIIELIDKKDRELVGEAQEFAEQIESFWLRSLDGRANNRIIIMFVSLNQLSETQLKELQELTEYGQAKLGTIFDTDAISVKSIYLNIVQNEDLEDSPRLTTSLSANLSESDPNLLVGTVRLTDLYWFLKSYRLRTGNLDQLFEKNVRRFLGFAGSINRAMHSTLVNEPAQFGLYNNGVTIVVEKFTRVASDHYDLVEPYIVNGCQTTRTIWEVFRHKYETGRFGLTPEIKNWREKISHGVVVVKVVTVGDRGEKLLHNITRYTNSQNAVLEGDFITLEDVFHRLQKEFAIKYNIFLEIQRGGWESQKAYQHSDKKTHQFTEFANAFELLKVYGAGWLREAGTAFSTNKPFLPGGDLYCQIIEDRVPVFDIDDLFAAYNLMKAARKIGFGYTAKKQSRKLTRYLFYLMTVDLLKDVLTRAELRTDPEFISHVINKLATNKDSNAWDTLIQCGLSAVDEYLTQSEEDSIFKEPLFEQKFNKNLNAILKSHELGRSDTSPRYASLMAINKRTMGRGDSSPREIITAAILSKS